MADRDFGLVLAPSTVRVQIDPGLVHNVLTSLQLINEADEDQGLNPWILETRQQMPPEQRRRNQLSAFFLPEDADTAWNSFNDYLAALERKDPAELVACSLEWVDEPQEKLADVEAYIAFARQKYAKHDKLDMFDEALYRDAHALLNQPAEALQLVVNHLRDMWTQYARQEFEQRQPMLQASVDAFRQLDYNGLTALEAIRMITGRDLTGKWDEPMEKINTLIFSPSPHIGPYVMLWTNADHSVGRVIFGARQPAGARVTSTAPTRSDLLVRLSALADDTRLQILELLTRHEELCAQDIIDMLKLSQSSASRHLRQLAATGYLLERRREVAKCYSLNQERIQDTVMALKQFLVRR